MSNYDHLQQDVAGMLEMPLPERVSFCLEDRWVGYTRAASILRQLDDLYAYPKAIRMPSVLIVGRSDNGKSSIVEQFVRRHPMTVDPDGRPASYVLWIAMPNKPTESNFWSEILWRLLVQHRELSTADVKRRQALEVMQYVGVRVLAIDELNHVVNAGKDAALLLAAIKNLSTKLHIPIVAAGTQAAINALNSDPQLKSRFEPAVLDRWSLSSEYLRLLASYERLLPLAEPSNLASRELAPVIYGLGGDTIGGTVRVLKNAAVHALRTGRERIDAQVLRTMQFVDSTGWEDAARRT